MEKDFTIKKINISDIENISEKKSLGVSKKFSLGIFFGVIFLFTIGIIGFDNFSNFSANILSSDLQENLHGSANSSNIFQNIFLILGILFFAIYSLYVFAKIEGQKFGEDFHKNQKNFVSRNFPSIYVLETLTMLYVIVLTVISFILIKNINFENAFSTLNGSIETVAIFSIFGGALSNLFFFLNKVRPGKEIENEEFKPKDIRMDFDINRVLRYLSFPFMSAGMGVISFFIIMGFGEIFGIDSMAHPSQYFIILLAIGAGYFCDAFVMFFHSIFKGIEANLSKKIAK